jgi:DNA polymerase elongation subunit (family B)
MSYVDALFEKNKDKIHVVERVNGERVYKEYPANYVFYYDDPKGKHRTIYGTPVTKFTTNNGKEFHKEMRINGNKRIWEGDFKPVFRCLENNYLGIEPPKLQTAFFDIEVDFDPERGYSKPDDPFNPINAISVYLDWLDKLITLAIPPKSMSWSTAQEIADKHTDCYIFEREEDLLKTFLDLIDDADILSGWNSEGYDIPYTVGRITRTLSKDDTRRLCLWGQFPKQREFERFGASQMTFDLIGRVHMDYMQLYRKYTYEERHSYSLDAIGEYELDERKTAYEGTLDQLYNRDFEKFIVYNRQDTRLLAKLDTKLRFLDLANTIAHDNTVLLMTTMGAVATTEQAIINEAHSQGLVVPNRKGREEDDGSGDDKAAGAYVAHPKKGVHEWIGAIDINSLYPSAIRSLNMGPETIIGQLRPVMTEKYIKEKMDSGSNFPGAWEGLFGSLEYEAVMRGDTGVEITIDWEATGTSDVLSAADVWRLIFDGNRPWTLSANGTIFTCEKKGIIPGLLERWYAERKEMQKKLKESTNKEDQEYWDKRQLVKKINLNSLYGAILNAGCRFFDRRIGQSTTLTGRAIAKHMDAFVNECITGEYDHTGDAIIYGDSVTGDTMIRTDSGQITIAELYNQCLQHEQNGEKEYGVQSFAKVVGFNAFEDLPVMSNISYVMRHKTKKKLYKITLQNDKSVTVTEDHSVMVDRDGFLLEVKPTEILDTDLIICLNT